MAVKIRDRKKEPDAEVWLENSANGECVLLRARDLLGLAGSRVLLTITNNGVELIKCSDGCGIATECDGRVKII